MSNLLVDKSSYWVGDGQVTENPVAFVEFSSPAATGLQTITAPSLGGQIPKAALIYFCHAETSEVSVQNSMMGRGGTDGTTQFALMTWHMHGQSANQCFKQGSDSLLINIRDDTSVFASASFDAFVAGGIRINWGVVNAAAAYKCIVIFFAGDNLDAKVGKTAHNTAGTVVNVGFEPQLMYFFSHNDLLTAASSQLWNFNHGFLHWDGAVLTQYSFTHSGGADGVGGSTSDDRYEQILNTRVIQQTDPLGNVQYHVTASAVTSTGLTLTGNLSAANSDDCSYLALQWNGDVNVKLGDKQVTNTGATKTFTGVGFAPDFLHFWMSSIGSAGFGSASNGFVQAGLGVASPIDGMASMQHCGEGNWNSGTGTTREHTSYSAGSLRRVLASGSQDNKSTVSSWDADGWKLSFTDQPNSNNGRWIYVAFEF